MPDSGHRSHLQRRRSTSTNQWASNGIIALLPVLACFLGGSTQKWAEGIVVAVLGAYLLTKPPHVSLGLATNCALAALVALTAMAFLPADWFFFPAWRSALINDFGITLPQTVSPQAWITGGGLISLIAGLAWLYVVSTQEIGLRAARFQLRLFVIGVVFLAAICIALYWIHAAFPFWKNERGFGPFPNRNHTADLFGITSIVLLACGQDDLRHSRKSWLFWLLGLAVLVTAIILDYSRAGIAILIGGSALWIGIVALRQRSAAPIALGLSFLLLLLSAILILGGQTLERFHLRGFEGPGVTTDFRWRIFHDTFQLIRASPWCGIGLGNFESIFAIFRNESLGNTRALHPESDWLWLWTEAGWPAVVMAVAGVALLVRRVFPLREGTNQRLRLACLFAALIFALHGLVDVPGHKVGTVFAGIFLLGLSLHRPLQLKPNRLIAIFFRLVGLALLVIGISWTVAAKGRMALPGSVGVESARQLSEVGNRARNFSQTIELTTHAFQWAPLDWQLYFLRATAEVAKKQQRNALADFRRARFLEPNSYEIPLAEGNIWMSSNPILATTAWRESLRRAGSDRRGVYSLILRTAPKNNPVIARLLEETGLAQPDLALAYLTDISGPSFDRALAEFLKQDPSLSKLSETQKLAFFTLWSDRGDREKLVRTVEQHPDWLQYAWFGIAKYYASKGDFRAAYQLTQRFGEPAALPRIGPSSASLDQLNERFYSSPDNVAVGYALYRKQMDAGKIDDALQTVRHFTEHANSPAYLQYLEAECWARKENWERAWNAWQAFWTARNEAGR